MTTSKKDNNQDRLKRMKSPNGKMMLTTPSTKDADASLLFDIWKDRPETKQSLFQPISHNQPELVRLMKLLPLLLILMVGCTAKVQPFLMQPNRLLTTSTDLTRQNTSDNPSIKSIKAGGIFSSNITVKKQDGTRERVQAKSVWGYSDKNGHVWRRQKRSFYEVVEVGQLVKYRTEVSTTAQVNGITQTNSQESWLFSRTLDSPIYSSRRRALRDTLVSSR